MTNAADLLAPDTAMGAVTLRVGDLDRMVGYYRDAVTLDVISQQGGIALLGRDGVVHLAGEPVDQRWSAKSKQAILESREAGTRNLVAGLKATDPRPGVLVSGSAVGYYGPPGAGAVGSAVGNASTAPKPVPVAFNATGRMC